MKSTLRIMALFLALLMLLPAIVACGKDDKGKEQNGGDQNAVTTDPNSGEYVSKLPAYDWEGDAFYILGQDGGAYNQFTNFEIWRENMDGTVVGDAVYTRNDALKKKYNFIVEAELVDNTYTESQTLYDAQDDIYDLVIYNPMKVFNHAASGYLTDLYGIDYLDFDHPAGSSYINTQLTVGGKLYCTSNKFLLQDKARTYTMFYNRELAREYELGYLEDHVDNNTWTLEEFEKCCRLFSFDIDGGGAGGIGDSFGVVAESHASYATLLYGAGFTLGTNDGETITLTGATDAMNTIVTNTGKIWFDKNVTAVPEDFQPIDWAVSFNIFVEERAPFFISFPSDFDAGKTGLNTKCNFEFGFMPFPKADSSQERYYNMMNYHNASVFAVPYTVSDLPQVGFYLEALSEESCDTSYTAYIDSKCKIQDSYDELTAKMLDLCFESTSYDVVACLDPGGIFTIICDQIPNFRTNIFIRLYNSKGDKPQTELDEYVTMFQEQ